METLPKNIVNDLIQLYQTNDHKKLQTTILDNLKIYNDPILYNFLGASHLTSGSYSEAENSFKLLLNKFPNYIEGYINLASLYQTQRNYDEALELYNLVLKKDNLNSDNKHVIFHNIGTIYVEISQYDKAISYLKDSLKINDKSFESYKNLGAAYRGLNDSVNSIKYYKLALDLVKDNNDLKSVYIEICSELAQLLRSEHNYSDAMHYINIGPKKITVDTSDVFKNNNTIQFTPIDIETNYSPHFIGCWDIHDDKLMDAMIAYFEKHPAKQTPGRAYGAINTDHKKSIDMTIYPSNLDDSEYSIFSDYSDTLLSLYDEYRKHWEILPSMPTYIGNLNIQKYDKGGHFQGLHTERQGSENMHHLFAWMTYLNDVDDGGCTYFAHFNKRFAPKKGRTIIWPADWTHAHCGEVVKSGVKYIINGWFDMDH